MFVLENVIFVKHWKNNITKSFILQNKCNEME